jgi:spermidine dehydrogenase
MNWPRITRRDFLDGTRIALTGALAGCAMPLARVTVPESPTRYPPALTGLRGSHAGSWEVAHARARGHDFGTTQVPAAEHYDLVVVGAGLSGLAAAFFYRQARPGARILILDNHDDFGGHAKRNEFRVGETFRLGYGGTEAIDSPGRWSPVALGLLDDLGIDLSRFESAYHHDLYASLGMDTGLFFDRETFGRDRLVPGFEGDDWVDFAEKSPLSEKARADLVRVNTSTEDLLPGLSREEKLELLRHTSYEDFLRDHHHADPQVLDLYRRRWITYYGTGTESFPASWVSWAPYLPGVTPTLNTSPPEEPYIYHFPDGNASIARLLVRGLNAAAVPGSSMEDVVTARVDYAALDSPEATVRIRLDSTVVDVRHDDGRRRVHIGYVRDERGEAISADHCILACWNAVIPHICPELPADQQAALDYAGKIPIIYVNVVIRSWRALVTQKVHSAVSPGSFFSLVTLDFPVSLGDYAFPTSPDEPIVLRLEHTPHHPEARGALQFNAGRREMLSTSFETYEGRLRAQLQRTFGPGGFEHECDILAITVNRWPHGYAYEANPLWDPAWESESAKPWVRGRKRNGRIAIANSDAGASALTDTAFDQARRAVDELQQLETR